MLFLSHSSEDKERVRALKAALEEEGLKVWLDEREIAPGTPLSETLSHNIAEATGLVVVGSEAAMKSPWVDRELAYAIEQGIPVIPVAWEDVKWPAKYQFIFAGAVRGRLRDGEEAEAARLIRKALDDQATRVQGILKPNILSAPKHRNPATLLNARFRVVPFFDEPRARELELLTSWCGSDGPAASVRLFTGPGGSGKTRLCIEWTSRLRDRRQMSAGFLREYATSDDLRVLARAPEAAFVVIDYAETRVNQLNDLLALLSDRPTSFPALRVALLAREHSSWWDRLGTSAKHLLDSKDPWKLEPVSLESHQRERAFQMAYDTFADGKGERPADPQLEDALFERMLYIHMAALAAAQGRRLASEGLLEDTVNREIRFWFPEGDPPRGFERRASRLVAAVTLRGRTPRRTLSALDRRVQGPDDPEFRNLIADLYAPVTDPVGRLVGGLQPDLLGEALISQVLSDPETPDHFLENTFEDADGLVLENGFVVLGRIGLWAPDVIESWLPAFFNGDVLKRTLPALNAFLSLGTTTARKPEGSSLLQALREFVEGRAGLGGGRSSEDEIPWAELVTVGYALSLVSASSRLTPPSAFGVLAQQGHVAEAATLARMSDDAEGLALVAIAAAAREDRPFALELLREALPLFTDSARYSDEKQSAVVDAVRNFGEQEDFQALFDQIGHPSVLAFFLGDGAELVEPESFTRLLSMCVESGPRTLASVALHAPPGNIPKDVLVRLADSVGNEETGHAVKVMSEVAGALMRMGQADAAAALARRALKLGTRLQVSNWGALAEAFDVAAMAVERDRALERAVALLSEGPENTAFGRVAGELARYWRIRGDSARIDWLAQWLDGREERGSEFSTVCGELARWYASTGQDELAVRWARAVERDETDGSLEQSAWSSAAQGFATAGRQAEAAKAAQTAAGFGYKSAFAFAEVAAILHLQGHGAKAETLARESIAAATRDAIQGLETECWSQLATALAAGGERAKARTLLSRATNGKVWHQVRALLALDQVDEAVRTAQTYKNPAVFEVLTKAVQTKTAEGDRGIVDRVRALVASTVAEMDSGTVPDGAEPDLAAELIGPDADNRLAHLALFLATNQDASTAEHVFRLLDPQIQQIPDFDVTDDDYETGSDFLGLPDLIMRVGCGWHQLGDDERAVPILLTGLRVLQAPKKSRDYYVVGHTPGVMQESVRCLAEAGADVELEHRLLDCAPDDLAYAARGLLEAQRPHWAARTASVALCRAAERGNLNKVHEVVGVLADVVLATAGVSDVAAMVDAMDRVVDWWS
jgi:tetratricopeptide (TPR) repeat protein